MKSYFDLLPTINSYERNFARYPLSYIKKFVKRPVTRYLFGEYYLGRFDLFSYDVYQTPYYWWAILAYNDILDQWDESLVGRIIECPHVQDIQDFLMAVRRSNID